nr:Imm41 family immunity protein [Herbaspirillum sp. ASV7]
MNPLSIVLDNFPHCEESSEQSFMSILHECQRIDMDAYWKLEWALVELTSPYDDYLRDQCWPVFRIFSHLSGLFCAHIDENDSFKITNFDDWFIDELIERTTSVFDGYFTGSMPDMHNRLQYANPLLESRDSSPSERKFRKPPSRARAANDQASEIDDQRDWLDLQTHTQCLEIIYQNFSCKMQWGAQSLLGILHNNHRLDMDAYRQLEWAVVWLTKGADKAPSPHGWPVHQIFILVTGMLYAHIDPDDQFEIKEMSNQSVHTLRKRINMVFDGFFKVKIPDMDAFEEGNPLLDDSRAVIKRR